MNFIFAKWKRNLKSLIVIFMGMIIGILSISIGFSFINDAIDFSKEIAGGDSKVTDTLIYNVSDIKNKDYLSGLENVLKELNKDYKISIGAVMYPVERSIPMSDAPTISPVMYNKSSEWKPNLIFGRYLSFEETLTDKKVAVIGYEIYKTMFKAQPFDEKMKLNLYGEEYEVIGVVGRTKRYSPQNSLIEVPYKNYFSFYKEEPDQSKIPIFVFGKKPISLNKDIYKNITVVDKPTYVNEIRIPLKLVMIVGALLLIVTIVNEGNLFSLWILNRRKEIAIKKALGATNSMIIMSVIFETIAIGIISSLIALSIQYIIQNKLNNILIDYELKITWINYLIAICISFIISLITTIIPSKIIISICSSEELKA